MELYEQKCKACGGWMKPYSKKEYVPYLSKLEKWKVRADKILEKEFKFKNFKTALNFVDKVGEIAEKNAHHPNILLFDFNKVRLTLYTHALNGLSLNDFILASKIDRI
jgi:4a-hydroxytetrahydrobiopterin dehydratase